MPTPGTGHPGRGLKIVAEVSNVEIVAEVSNAEQLGRQAINENGLFPPTNAPSINVGHVILQQQQMQMSSVGLNRD